MHQSGWIIVLFSATATAQVTLSVPTHIRSGETLALGCGRIYSGELDLANLHDVTVTTRMATAVRRRLRRHVPLLVGSLIVSPASGGHRLIWCRPRLN